MKTHILKKTPHLSIKTLGLQYKRAILSDLKYGSLEG